MVVQVVWTERASADLRQVFDYIRLDSEANAIGLVTRLLAAAEALSDVPLSGRIVPEFGRKEIRELIFGSYRLVYRIRRGKVQMLRVSHSARLLRLK